MVRGKAKWQTDHGKLDGIARRTIWNRSWANKPLCWCKTSYGAMRTSISLVRGVVNRAFTNMHTYACMHACMHACIRMHICERPIHNPPYQRNGCAHCPIGCFTPAQWFICPRTVPNGPPRDAIQFAVVGLPFGLTSNHFMWIWGVLGTPWATLGGSLRDPEGSRRAPSGRWRTM